MLQSIIDSRFNKYAGLAVLLSLFLVPSLVLAQENVSELEEVEVRGKSLEGELSADLAKYGNQVEIITEEEIEKSGQNDVIQILQKSAPGLHVNPRHGNRMGEADPSLQGGDDSSLIWLLDGVRVSMRIFDTFRPFIPPQYIKRIEVIKGGQGLIYGTKGIDGVINIVTKSPEDINEGEVSIGVGTIGDQAERNLHGIATHKDGKNRFMVLGAQNQGNAQIFRDQDFDTTAQDRLRDWDVNSIGLKWNRDLGENESLRLNLLRNEMKIERNVASNIQRRVNQRTQDVFSLKYEKQFDPRKSFFVKTYWHDWDSEWTNISVNDDGSLTTFDNDTPWWFEDYGFNAMGKYEQKNGSELLAGLDLQKVTGADFVTNTKKSEETIWAPYAIYRPVLGFSPTTDLSFGGRYNKADRGDNSFVWNASGRHPLNEQFYVRFSGGESFRNPNITELFQNDDDGNVSFGCGPVPTPCSKLGASVAGEELEPEESLGFNVGIGGNLMYKKMPLTWELGYFDREIDNLIDAQDLTGSGDTAVPRNVSGESTRDGIEAQFSVKIDREWEVRANGTWLDSRNAGSSQQPDLIPESFMKGTLAYDDRSGRWGSRLMADYTGKIYDTISTSGRTEFGQYVLFDLAGYYNFAKSGNKKLSFRVENLLDAEEAFRLDTATDPSGTTRRVEHIVPKRNLQLKYTQKF